MPEGDSIDRATAAMRTALCDRRMLRFDAPRLIGVVPRAGRTIERVERRGRHVHVDWDDGVTLHTHLRSNASWHVHRAGDSWRRTHDEVRALIEVAGWVAVCFGAPVVETYRRPDAGRHPGLGGVGPDLARADADLARCIQRLAAYHDPAARLGEVLLDQRVFCGVGNVLRSEVLWASELSPFAPVGELASTDAVQLVNVAARTVRAQLRGPAVAPVAGAETETAVYGRCGQPCLRCGASVRSRPLGPQDRVVYWCPGCQVRLVPPPPAADETLAMDRHPAAAAFLADLPWRRTG
jgi:endonuclease-8